LRKDSNKAANSAASDNYYIAAAVRMGFVDKDFAGKDSADIVAVRMDFADMAVFDSLVVRMDFADKGFHPFLLDSSGFLDAMAGYFDRIDHRRKDRMYTTPNTIKSVDM
jgi:hypothetical protein